MRFRAFGDLEVTSERSSRGPGAEDPIPRVALLGAGGAWKRRGLEGVFRSLGVPLRGTVGPLSLPFLSSWC